MDFRVERNRYLHQRNHEYYVPPSVDVPWSAFALTAKMDKPKVAGTPVFDAVVKALAQGAVPKLAPEGDAPEQQRDAAIVGEAFRDAATFLRLQQAVELASGGRVKLESGPSYLQRPGYRVAFLATSVRRSPITIGAAGFQPRFLEDLQG